MYKVIGPDGGLYGPVDLPTLKSWAAEGRLEPRTWVVEATTDRRYAASEIPGLFPQAAGPYAEPYGYLPVQGKSSRTKLTGILLAVFLGFLGVHRFYIGHTAIGVIQLLLTVLSCGILAVVPMIWGYVDAVMMATGSLTDDRGLELS